ncbi:hypothetical protein FRC01_013400 [Tulasnella sp. 417]|nr:hypothetical protein FRC01_013400 [Tulasnella sp. 417]
MRRHIPSCPVRRRQNAAIRAARPNSNGRLALPGGSFTPLREQTQTLEPGWPSSSRTTPSPWGSSIPPSSTPRAMHSPTPGLQSSLHSPYTPNDGSAWRQTSIADAQHEASRQPSRPFLEPSFSPHPHPPVWSPTPRTPHELPPLRRPSPPDTISPRDNSSMRWSPGSTIGGLRESQSRFGSTEDLRFGSTPVSVQRYSSDFPSQLQLPDPQGSRSQMPSSAAGTPSLIGSLPLNVGASTTPESVQPQVQQVSSFTPMTFATRPGSWSRRGAPRPQPSPGQGPAQWNAFSQRPPAAPYETADRRAGRNEDYGPVE